MKNKQNPYRQILIAGMIMLLVFGSHLATVIFQSDNIWWTPMSMKLSIDDSSDRVEVFIKEKPLVDILNDGGLMIQDKSEITTVNNADISFRFNNYDKMRASQLARVGIISALVMASLMMIAYALVFMKRTRTSE